MQQSLATLGDQPSASRPGRQADRAGLPGTDGARDAMGLGCRQQQALHEPVQPGHNRELAANYGTPASKADF